MIRNHYKETYNKPEGESISTRRGFLGMVIGLGAGALAGCSDSRPSQTEVPTTVPVTTTETPGVTTEGGELSVENKAPESGLVVDYDSFSDFSSKLKPTSGIDDYSRRDRNDGKFDTQREAVIHFHEENGIGPYTSPRNGELYTDETMSEKLIDNPQKLAEKMQECINAIYKLAADTGDSRNVKVAENLATILTDEGSDARNGIMETIHGLKSGLYRLSDVLVDISTIKLVNSGETRFGGTLVGYAHNKSGTGKTITVVEEKKNTNNLLVVTKHLHAETR